jgi:hypothetical protein
MRAALVAFVAVVLACTSLAGCERERARWKTEQIDRKLIEIDGEHMTLHTGSVGAGAHQSTATYVLVDATNPTDKDVAVTLGGSLLDAKDAPVGRFERQCLRLPAGGTRTFALVDTDQQARPTATGATIEVTSALVLEYPEQITITDLHQYEDGNRIVVKGYLRNTVDRPGKALAIASFYDRDGRPMKRPSTVFKLGRQAKRGIQFVGPSGSVRATLFVGDIVY